MRKALAEFVQEVDLRSGTGSSVTPFSELLDRWLEQITPDRSPATIYTYQGYIRRDILPTLGAIPVGRLSAEHLDRFYRALGGRGVASGTIRQQHAIVRSALGQGVKWGWVDDNVALKASPPPLRRKLPQPPTPQAVALMIDQAKEQDPQFGLFLNVAALTGARRGELCALRWSDIDFRDNLISIGRALVDVGSRVTEKDTKTHAVRVIAVEVELMAELYAHRQRLIVRADEQDVTFKGVCGFVFPTPTSLAGDVPVRPDLVTRDFRRLAKQMGVDCRFHDLRHMSATQLISNGVDPRTVAGRLGHADPSTTLRIYAHWDPPSDRAASGVLAGVLEVGKV